jgi:hypothetical protein
MIYFKDLGISLNYNYNFSKLFLNPINLIDAKAWRVNKLVTLTIHLAEVTEDVIEVLAIDILPSFSNRRHSHIQEVRTRPRRLLAFQAMMFMFFRGILGYLCCWNINRFYH